MSERMNARAAEAERIEDTGPALPQISAAEFAAGLGAEPCGAVLPPGLSLLSAAELGIALLKQLRFGRGGAALADASHRCAAPLSKEDVAALTDIVAAIERATGSRPSLGQIANVVVRMHVDTLRSVVGEGEER